MKKIGLLVLMVLFLICLIGCNPMGFYDYYEDGDFVFAYSKDDIESQELSLYGLSEEGKKKEYLIFPEEYNGQRVDKFGVTIPAFGGGVFYRDDLKSSILKKIFINFNLKNVYDDYFRFSNEDPFEERDKYSFVVWYDFNSQILSCFEPITNTYIFGNNLLNNEETKKYITYDVYGIANVSYIYNYEEAPNDGYYWVDNYDNDLIEYIPPEPTREGYTFGGWYKEAECINEWDFNNDKTSSSYIYYEEPNEDSTEEYKEFYNEYISTHTYIETKLYAKWIKN